MHDKQHEETGEFSPSRYLIWQKIHARRMRRNTEKEQPTPGHEVLIEMIRRIAALENRLDEMDRKGNAM